MRHVPCQRALPTVPCGKPYLPYSYSQTDKLQAIRGAVGALGGLHLGVEAWTVNYYPGDLGQAT